MNLGSWGGWIGHWQESIGLPADYFLARGVFLDCRGSVTISPTSTWGICVKVLSESHDISRGPGQLGAVVQRPVVVEDGAWIGSYTLLLGCRIGVGSIVAAGSVVRGQNVAPGVMVAGNPARVVARWDGAKWAYLDVRKSGYERELA